MIESYNPWGRKGGGAPNRTIRMSNIYQEGLYPEPKTVSSECSIVKFSVVLALIELTLPFLD